MAVGVGGRILIRHLGRCEMGKWDKLSRRGVQESGAFMLLFGEIFFFFPFFFSSAILVKVQKGLVRRKKKQAPLWNWRQLFTGLLAAHMSEVFCHMAV